MQCDFNARVRSRADDDDQRDDVRGPHGYSLVNDTGKKNYYHSSLSSGQQYICNTWLEKKDIQRFSSSCSGRTRGPIWHCKGRTGQDRCVHVCARVCVCFII